MQSHIKKAPKIYFSFRSPFSWLGVDRLLTRRPSVVDDCAWIPFWDPSVQTDAAVTAAGGGNHYVQMSKAKHLYILQDAKRLCTKYGKSMAWPIDRDPVWEIPHLAWLASDPADRLRVYSSITDMRWRTGENICDANALEHRLSTDLLNPALALAYEDEAVQRRAVGCLTDAYNDDIFGIPYFKAGSHRFWGLERVDWFIAAYDKWRETGKFEIVVPTELVSANVQADTDAPGGCG